jgi:hypothetical protein
MKIMMKSLTRTELILTWLVAVTVVSAAVIVLNGAPSVGTSAIALALSIAPAVVVLLLWPRPQPPTAADVLYDRNTSA